MKRFGLDFQRRQIAVIIFYASVAALFSAKAEEVEINGLREVIGPAVERAGDPLRFEFESDSFSLLTDVDFQYRYLIESVDGAAETTGRPVFRRGKLGARGHLLSPKLEYRLKFGPNPLDDPNYETAYLQYAFSENCVARVGQFKAGFLGEDEISPTRQQAVERSVLNAYHSIGFTRGLYLIGKEKNWQWEAIVHKGRGSRFDADEITDFAASGRIEWAYKGKLSDFRDFAAWSRNEPGVLLGAGFDGGLLKDLGNLQNYLAWTVDASVKLPPFNGMVAVVGRRAEIDGGAEPEQIGLVAQGGFFLLPDRLDLFARWEWIDHGGYGNLGKSPTVGFQSDFDTVTLYTVGGNYFVRKNHDTKFSADIVWAPEGLRMSVLGAGLRKTENGAGSATLRLQFQQLF